MEQGLVHLYWGEGKGKTTAALGLALRALGQGRRVVVLQFLKDGTSGETGPLSRLGAELFFGLDRGKFSFQMTAEERSAARRIQTERLAAALERPCGLLVLDEACAVWEMDLVDREALRRAVLDRPAGREVVLTGRSPAPWMAEAADYSTEMRCVRHPYRSGVPARLGIEF